MKFLMPFFIGLALVASQLVATGCKQGVKQEQSMMPDSMEHPTSTEPMMKK